MIPAYSCNVLRCEIYFWLPYISNTLPYGYKSQQRTQHHRHYGNKQLMGAGAWHPLIYRLRPQMRRDSGNSLISIFVVVINTPLCN